MTPAVPTLQVVPPAPHAPRGLATVPRPTAPRPTTVPSTVPTARRVPLSVLDLVPADAPGPLPGSRVWAEVARDPRHPGVAAGESAVVAARVAGRLGLPFAVDHRTTTRSVRAAVAVYRAAFDPSPGGGRPYVLVVADVVVASTAAAARALAPEARDRFVGSPDAVVAGLDVLVAVTGADELLITSTAASPADRRAGLGLLATAWASA